MDIYWNMDISPILSGFILDVTGFKRFNLPGQMRKKGTGPGKIP